MADRETALYRCSYCGHYTEHTVRPGHPCPHCGRPARYRKRVQQRMRVEVPAEVLMAVQLSTLQHQRGIGRVQYYTSDGKPCCFAGHYCSVSGGFDRSWHKAQRALRAAGLDLIAATDCVVPRGRRLTLEQWVRAVEREFNAELVPV